LHCSHTADALRVGRRLIAIEAREFIDHAAHAEQVAPRSRAFALARVRARPSSAGILHYGAAVR
jgi:hypothetical protein